MRLVTSGPFIGMPASHYGVILADCPWHTDTWSIKGLEKKSAALHYRTMTESELCGLPVAQIAHKNAWLFLWVCGPQLFQAERVMNAWGFQYSGYAFEWIKQTRYGLEFMGGGKTTRANMELCLLARRGQPPILSRGVRELIDEREIDAALQDLQEPIDAPVREHSRKPYESHLRIERFTSGPYVELFARQARPRWHRWGYEAPPGPGSWRPDQSLSANGL